MQQETGDIGEQEDDDGGHFYMGSEGENAPVDF